MTGTGVRSSIQLARTYFRHPCRKLPSPNQLLTYTKLELMGKAYTFTPPALYNLTRHTSARPYLTDASTPTTEYKLVPGHLLRKFYANPNINPPPTTEYKLAQAHLLRKSHTNPSTNPPPTTEYKLALEIYSVI